MEKKQNDYATLMEDFGEVGKINSISKQREDLRVSKKEEAKKELRAYAYQAMPQNQKPGSASNLSEENVQFFTNLGLTKAKERSAKNLYNNLETILNEIPQESIGKLSRGKEIVERANAEEKDVFDAYVNWKSYEDFKKRYQKGEQLSEKENEIVVRLASKGLGEESAKAAEKEGYSTDVQEIYRNSAYIVVKNGYVKGSKKDVLAGMDILIAKRKINYESQDLGKVEDISKKIFSRMVNGNSDEFNLALDIIYRSR